MKPESLTVWCLIDPRRESVVVKHLQDQGVKGYNINTVAPIYRETIVGSINASHKEIVQRCLDMELPYACVCEQDAYFPAPDGLAQWCKHIEPAGFSLQLAGAYNIPNMERLRELKQTMPEHDFLQISYMSGPEGFHAYILFKWAYKQFLALPDDEHIDIAAVAGLSCSVIYPMCAIQLAGYSSTAGRWTDKNVTLDQRDVYGEIPKAKSPQ
jgi:hypothetical protein